ncbi:DEKNAAC103591 [Brettanomyces naardenensis]|uniref:DEKNAAC103591 n=1 Tax=Brettanomyces naardenensis TaxID=13370 RepID=A0A448YNA0_BRENA|nr:DEKNAAC103591 [Brettanomyces naardenensis]
MATKKSVNHISPIVLPNGKIGTLPPRKRARTQEEKEQRRIERIIRNRRAAHASREKKRRHVEQLEMYAKLLEQKIEEFEKVQSNFQSIQSKLVSRLEQSQIDISDIDISIEAVASMERPEDLDLETSSHPVKRQKSCATPSTSFSESPSPSPVDVKDEEDLEIPSPEAEITRSTESKPYSTLPSPPPSTAASKFRLDDSDILKQDYSNLFDQDVFMAEDVNTPNDGSLKLFDQDSANNDLGNEAIDSKISLELFDQNQDVFRSDDMDYLNCLNDVHHSAVLMSR